MKITGNNWVFCGLLILRIVKLCNTYTSVRRNLANVSLVIRNMYVCMYACMYLHCYGPPVSMDVMTLLKIQQHLETRRTCMEIVALQLWKTKV